MPACVGVDGVTGVTSRKGLLVTGKSLNLLAVTGVTGVTTKNNEDESTAAELSH
jgi:hypothetical protein